MAIVFQKASLPPLESLSVTAPNGAVIGVVGGEGSGVTAVLKLAAGVESPSSGRVDATEPKRLLGLTDSLNLAPVGTLALDHTLAPHDALVRARTLIALERMRRSGVTVLLASHEPDLLLHVCDEIWWIDQGRLAAKGDPREVLEQYQRDVSRRLRDWAASISQPLAPAFRRGDGRAEIVAIEVLDETGQPTMSWPSGTQVSVRVRVRFARPVADPVVGVMVRTRIGFEVYGTNTELEGVPLGPVQAGDTFAVTFSFRCDLCPQEYTVTAASHDPDGIWHDWLEDAVAVTVTDDRRPAGVANLRAKVSVERRG